MNDATDTNTAADIAKDVAVTVAKDVVVTAAGCVIALGLVTASSVVINKLQARKAAKLIAKSNN